MLTSLSLAREVKKRDREKKMFPYRFQHKDVEYTIEKQESKEGYHYALIPTKSSITVDFDTESDASQESIKNIDKAIIDYLVDLIIKNS